MKIIVFEGLDKSGKHTVSTKVAEMMNEVGVKTVHSEFHRYDTPTGKLIQDWLYGRYDVSDRTIEMIMLADKQAQQEWFNELEQDGVQYLILDRYLDSQLAYASYKDLSIYESVDFGPYELPATMVELVKEGHKGMREPDIVIYLSIDVETSMERKGQHGENDRYESDKKLLTHVKDYFDEQADNNPYWITVSGERTPNMVIDDVLNFIEYEVTNGWDPYQISQ